MEVIKNTTVAVMLKGAEHGCTQNDLQLSHLKSLGANYIYSDKNYYEANIKGVEKCYAVQDLVLFYYNGSCTISEVPKRNIEHLNHLWERRVTALQISLLNS